MTHPPDADAIRLMITCQILILERGEESLGEDAAAIAGFVLGSRPPPPDLRVEPALTSLAARLLRESDLDPDEVAAIADRVIEESGDELERLRESLRMVRHGERRARWWRRRRL
ncbi:hypothetical protein ACTI_07330 [Actinoplanes sp. OR16]|uniref:hypothetical protein n=1 Tax=Actinoplanes sp. OR16 TaxID=946334 RepID=UPI000F6D5838|nr:hypothetical protein [Actinoplanes sp. OR16]BBH64048.1 hypothetical protein ACTI_07330 [Actinoplanes sp. OR16]